MQIESEATSGADSRNNRKTHLTCIGAWSLRDNREVMWVACMNQRGIALEALEKVIRIVMEAEL